jgi:myo-inositol-1(or 4)-monophosphatase
MTRAEATHPGRDAPPWRRRIKDVAIGLAVDAGKHLMTQFGAQLAARSKTGHSNVVTAADVSSENLIVQGIRACFPEHSIIAEESGVDLRSSELTWVIDPLDGTSNFAAGIPWFGVLIAVLTRGEPSLGVLYLPASDKLYVAEHGNGAYRNGRRIAVAQNLALKDALWAYGVDGSGDEARQRAQLSILRALIPSVRNVRATNSLVDAAFTADGRLGGMLNVSTSVWDIAAPSLIVREAGGRYTGLGGAPLRFDLSTTACQREYAVLAGAPSLHAEVIALLHAAGLSDAGSQ